MAGHNFFCGFRLFIEAECAQRSPAIGGAELGYNLKCMFYTYILRLATGKLYVGHTYDLRKRLAEHRRGGVAATRLRRPMNLEFYAAFTSKDRARDFERYLKSSSGKAFRNKRLV